MMTGSTRQLGRVSVRRRGRPRPLLQACQWRLQLIRHPLIGQRPPHRRAWPKELADRTSNVRRVCSCARDTEAISPATSSVADRLTNPRSYPNLPSKARRACSCARDTEAISPATSSVADRHTNSRSYPNLPSKARRACSCTRDTEAISPAKSYVTDHHKNRRSCPNLPSNRPACGRARNQEAITPSRDVAGRSSRTSCPNGYCGYERNRLNDGSLVGHSF